MGLKDRLDDERVGREAKLAKAVNDAKSKKDEEAAIREMNRDIIEQTKVEALVRDKERFAKEAYMRGRSDERPKVNMDNINANLLMQDAEQELSDKAMQNDGEPSVEELDRFIEDEQRQRQQELSNKAIKNDGEPSIEELDRLIRDEQAQGQQAPSNMAMQNDGEPSIEELDRFVREQQLEEEANYKNNMNNKETPPINELNEMQNETQLRQDGGYTVEELRQAELDALKASQMNNASVNGSLGITPEVFNAVNKRPQPGTGKEPDERITEYAKQLLNK